MKETWLMRNWSPCQAVASLKQWVCQIFEITCHKLVISRTTTSCFLWNNMLQHVIIACELFIYFVQSLFLFSLRSTRTTIGTLFGYTIIANLGKNDPNMGLPLPWNHHYYREQSSAWTQKSPWLRFLLSKWACCIAQSHELWRCFWSNLTTMGHLTRIFLIYMLECWFR